MYESTTKYSNLKKQAPAGVNFLQPWTKENILDGFNKFFEENNRYPTAEEIDEYEYLPSSRQIQRAFGGLKNLRAILGLPITDFASGESRSKISYEISKRGLKGEREIEKILIEHFGEHFVHIEKPLFKYFDDTATFKDKLRADFFIYHKNGIFCVDVFYAKNKNMINGNLNIKRKKYNGIKIKTYFVVLSDKVEFSTNMIEDTLKGKKNKLDPNIITLNKADFLKEFYKYKPLSSI